jgi:DNA-binding transcriptional MerR regulator
MSLNRSLHNQAYVGLMSDMNYFDALNYIRERSFSRKDLGISYRELNHWSTEGLLYEDNEKGRWRKFNVLEIIWIELIKELRLYNIAIPVIIIIKKAIDRTSVESMAKQIPVAEFESIIKEMFSEEEYLIIINSDIHKQLLENQIFPLIDNAPKNVFEIIVLEAFFLKFQYRFICNYDGESTFSNELYDFEMFDQPEYKLRFDRSNISISINQLIAKIFQNYTNTELKVKWKLINDDENKVLELIRSDKKLKSITIRFNKESKIDLLEYKHELKVSLEHYVKNLVLKGGFEEIKIVTQKGDIAFCEKTVKEKF